MMDQQRKSRMRLDVCDRLTCHSPGVPPLVIGRVNHHRNSICPIIFLHDIRWCTCSSTVPVQVTSDLLLLLMDQISQIKLHQLCDGVEVAAKTWRKEKPHNH
ncbi:hypothetical protein PVAP13_9NG267073 [Panicum virgatum]|uniref:Uncharacterized protein n=1 Tax=Panicum virgatum TaxID=38727 RepID=A0A8T0ML32_PANVG|nr:hypothetical protein PVAP13_9NG267073 [Panicum virgatum]